MTKSLTPASFAGMAFIKTVEGQAAVPPGTYKATLSIGLTTVSYTHLSDTHKYSYNNVITAIQERLKKQNIRLNYKSGFNQYVLNLVIDFYDIKHNVKYAYEHIIGNQRSYTYSQQFIDFIVTEIKKDPQNYV